MTKFNRNFERSEGARLFRLAPTPSGLLHLGNVFSFLWTVELKNSCHGKLWLRIDDFDAARTKVGHIENIFQVLEFLDIDWDLGPKNVEEACSEHFSQSKRMAELKVEFWEFFNCAPNSVYICECSKASLKNRVSDLQLYDGFCRDRSLEFTEERGVRFRNSRPQQGAGDAWLLRRDGVLAYQWISLVEDVRWDVSDVVRGMDLLDSSRFQKEVANSLVLAGFAEFEAFQQTKVIHHPLLKGEDEVKLSKNRRDLSFLDLVKDQGWKRADVWEQFYEWKERVGGVVEL